VAEHESLRVSVSVCVCGLVSVRGSVSERRSVSERVRGWEKKQAGESKSAHLSEWNDDQIGLGKLVFERASDRAITSCILTDE